MDHSDCIFCKIVEGKIPSKKIFENENVLGFIDLNPLAAKHFLFINKSHTKDINDLMGSDPHQIQTLFKAMSDFSKAEGLNQKGFRIVTNLGPYAGQTVFHTHFHLLGGELLGRFGK
jgi:histidine triad (HIT) family protein